MGIPPPFDAPGVEYNKTGAQHQKDNTMFNFKSINKSSIINTLKTIDSKIDSAEAAYDTKCQQVQDVAVRKTKVQTAKVQAKVVNNKTYNKVSDKVSNITTSSTAKIQQQYRSALKAVRTSKDPVAKGLITCDVCNTELNDIGCCPKCLHINL